MALFNFPWLRNFIRRHTKPMPIQTAGRWKARLSVIYAILTWNALAVVAYAVMNGKADWAKYHGLVSEQEAKMTPAQYYAQRLGIQKASVIRISGTNVSTYEVEGEKEQSEAKENEAEVK